MLVVKNPVCEALSQTQQSWAIDLGNALAYHSDYTTFLSFKDGISPDRETLEKYALENESFFMVGKDLTLPEGFKSKRKITCLQMSLNRPVQIEESPEIEQLNLTDKPMVTELFDKVMPEFYREKTMEMGNYFGIRENNKLIAVVGQRMQADSWTEVSAVMTDPDYAGRGLATKLTKWVSYQIQQTRKTPILHVNKENKAAIRAYEKVGYDIATEIVFWWIVKV